MTNAGQNQQSDKATSRRNVMIGGLVAVSTLASLPLIDPGFFARLVYEGV